MRPYLRRFPVSPLLSVAAAALVVLWSMATAHAQQAGTALTLSPHCMEKNRSACAQFSIENAERLKTEPLNIGDLLDIDVVLHSPEPAKIYLVRSWLKYDPQILEARSIDLASALAEPLPGEQAIDAQAGTVKIGGSAGGRLTDTSVAIARVTFRVVSTQRATEISFLNFDPLSISGETIVATIEAETLKGMLSIKPPSLHVRLAGAQDDSLPSQPERNDTDESPQPGNAAFTVLQVQGVAATSKDNNILVGWQALQSSDLQGYNVYYGTVSGKYIQRRSLPGSEHSLIIRDLAANTRYFLAVRGYSGNNEETAFSQEVSVTVGKPETSTAPLSNNQIQSKPKNIVGSKGGKTVTGETGIGTELLLFIIVSAAMGTVLALRRQMHPITLLD